MYIPYQQFPWLVEGPKHLVVRTSATVKPESLVRAVTQEIHRVDKNQPVADITMMEEIALEPMKQQRMVMALLTSFAGLALSCQPWGSTVCFHTPWLSGHEKSVCAWPWVPTEAACCG